jgi:hypothetical protein
MAKPLFNIGDSELIAVARNTLGVIATNPSAYGASAADAAALEGLVDSFEADLKAQKAAKAAVKSATVKKNKSRAPLMAALRNRRDVAKAAKTSPADLTKMGIPSSTVSRAPSATIPFGRVDTSDRYRHTIHWTDAESLDNKRKPRGVLGCEIWVRIGSDAPGNEKDCNFLTVDASTPYAAEYAPADAGKTAHYMLRWRMRDGAVSAWSETISATITG